MNGGGFDQKEEPVLIDTRVMGFSFRWDMVLDFLQ
jgi:hypothetical protein